MMLHIQKAIENGHPVCWEGDISEEGFIHAKDNYVDIPENERPVTPTSRQEEFEQLRTTDDHVMEIIGTFLKDEQRYYVCRNSHYKPETLGQFMNDLSLKENLTFVFFGGTQMKNGKDICDVEYTNVDKAKVWKLLFSDTVAKAAKDYDSMNFETAADIAIDLKLLGYENISLAVTRDGYLTTNILDTGKAFYIGKPAAEKFLSYLEKDCKTTIKHKYDYSESTSGGGSGNSASYSVSHSVGSN